MGTGQVRHCRSRIHSVSGMKVRRRKVFRPYLIREDGLPPLLKTIEQTWKNPVHTYEMHRVYYFSFVIREKNGILPPDEMAFIAPKKFWWHLTGQVALCLDQAWKRRPAKAFLWSCKGLGTRHAGQLLYVRIFFQKVELLLLTLPLLLCCWLADEYYAFCVLCKICSNGPKPQNKMPTCR